jgi:two-component system sensor histidine kinase YesM
MKRIWNRTSFQGRLLITYLLLVSVLIIVISVQYYSASKSMAANIVRNNLHDTVVKNNEILDSRLE